MGQKCEALMKGERGPERIVSELVGKADLIMEGVINTTSREAKKLIREYKERVRGLVKEAEELKKESEEELKTEREKENLKRRMREVEEDVEMMEKMNRMVREEDWTNEQMKIEVIVVEKMRQLLGVKGNVKRRNLDEIEIKT